MGTGPLPDRAASHPHVLRHSPDIPWARPPTRLDHERVNDLNPTAPSTAEPAAMPGWKRNVTLFLAGQTASMFGSLLVQFAVVWHLTIRTQSGAVMMWAVVFGMVPQAIMSVFGGVWADRHSRKALIIGSDLAIAALSLVMALVLASGVDHLWVVLLALGLRSACMGVQSPSVNAVLPQIVPEDQLLRINGVNQSLASIMMLAAPGVAAAMYAGLGVQSLFFVDVATALAASALLLLIPVAKVASAAPGSEGDDVAADGDARPGYFADLVGGLRYIRSHRPVQWLMVLFTVAMVLIGAPSYLTTLMVVRTFGGEVWMVSGNEIAWAIGMLAGGAVMAVFAARLTNRFLLIVGAVVVSGALTSALGLATNLWVFYAIGLLLAFAFTFMNTPAFTILQETVEPEMLGRVFGFVGIVMSVAMPASMLVFGPLADRFSVESLLVVAGILLLAFMAGLLAVPSARRSIQTIARPADGGVEPAADSGREDLETAAQA